MQVTANELPVDSEKQWRTALLVWATFVGSLIVINGTIPFLLGADVHGWVSSKAYSLLTGFLLYGVLCLGVTLTLAKGWATVRRPSFFWPLVLAIAAATAHTYVPASILIVAVLIYLHRRFGLVNLGIRSRGWRGDVLALGLPVLVASSQIFFKPLVFAPEAGVAAALNRWFINPASTAENLFYFGFLTDRLSYKTGKWTPLLIGAMYAAHEMTNPEYWYGGMNFVLVFVGIAVIAGFYLWRRSLVVVWVSDGLNRRITATF